jgi:hypothetical protein
MLFWAIGLLLAQSNFLKSHKLLWYLKNSIQSLLKNRILSSNVQTCNTSSTKYCLSSLHNNIENWIPDFWMLKLIFNKRWKSSVSSETFQTILQQTYFSCVWSLQQSSRNWFIKIFLIVQRLQIIFIVSYIYSMKKPVLVFNDFVSQYYCENEFRNISEQLIRRWTTTKCFEWILHETGQDAFCD